MSKKTLTCAVLAAVLTTAIAPATQAAVASPTPAVAVTTINYDADGAAELTPQVEEAIKIWNEKLKNVQFVKGPGGISASTHDSGVAPGLASCIHCTRGTVKFYRTQIKDKNAGPLRVVVHEFGHILGLTHPAQLHQEDEVMSGGPFTKAIPSAKECKAADDMWAGSVFRLQTRLPSAVEEAAVLAG